MKGVALAGVAAGLGARHSDMELWLVIRDDLVTTVVCADYSALMVHPLRVINGAFAGTASDGVIVSGRIVSATGAVGTIDTPACPGTRSSQPGSPEPSSADAGSASSAAGSVGQVAQGPGVEAMGRFLKADGEHVLG